MQKSVLTSVDPGRNGMYGVSHSKACSEPSAAGKELCVAVTEQWAEAVHSLS